MYRSESCLPFFSSVVKNVANPNVEIKKLVYIYLLRYAEEEPDLALLSINTIQKSLTDQNPQIRAMALRTMSGIRVPVISQIVSLAIKRGCGDMNPLVRKAAALAIPKCYRLDPKSLPQLTDYLSILLGDSQYFVVGPAVAAFMEVCPDRIDLIHKHYRSIVRKLVDMDEWGQLATLRLMTVYARKCFPRRTQKVKKSALKGFYEDNDVNNVSTTTEVEGHEEEIQVVDPDLDLLLKTCIPLLQSRNSAVIVAVVRCFRYLGTVDQLESTVGPLIALLRSPQDIQLVALYHIIAVALAIPNAFTRYVSRFLVHSTDSPQIQTLKLEVLTLLFPHCGMHIRSVILCELEHFSNGFDTDLVRESVRAIGRCAENDPSTAKRCLGILLQQLSSVDENLVSEALTVIRHLIQQDPASHAKTVRLLAKRLNTITSPGARATIVWLIGEFAGIDVETNIAPDMLRILAKGFANEPETVKQQILLLGAKVYLHHLLNKAKDSKTEQPSEQEEKQEEGESASGIEQEPPQEDTITILWRYILLLTRYDTSYDLRDRARLYKALLVNPSATELASLLLLAPKPVPHTPSPSESRKNLLLGTTTLVLGPDAPVHGLPGYEALPDWVKPGDEPDSRLRDVEGRNEFGEKAVLTAGERLDRALKEHAASGGAGAAGAAAAAAASAGIVSGKGKNISLDDWLAESEEEEEVEEEEGSTEEESSEGEYEDDEEEEEEEEYTSGEYEEETDEEAEDEREDEKAPLAGPSKSS